MATVPMALRDRGEASLSENDACFRWLEAATGRRDLTMAPPGDDDRSVAVRYVASTIAAEFIRYGEILAAARRAVRENGAALRAVVDSAEQQRRTVRHGVEDVRRAGDGALSVSEAATALQRFADAAAAARADAVTELRGTHVLLGDLEGALTASHRPIERMTASVATVRAFVMNLERIARHAKLLSVNASIEAAHLSSATRFGIVAREIRRLSESTRTASDRVNGVALEWHESTVRVESALSVAGGSTLTARSETAQAAEILEALHGLFDIFSESVATVAVVSAQQQAAFDSVVTAVGQIAEGADNAASAAAAASALQLDVHLESAERTLAAWTCGDAALTPVAAPSEDRVALHLIALTGDHGDALDAPADDTGEATLKAARRLLARADDDQRAILADITHASIAVAENLIGWVTIARSFRDIQTRIDTVGRAVEEATAGARTALSMSEEMRTMFAALGERLEKAAALLTSSLAKIAETASGVATTEALATTMSDAAGRAREALAFITELSAETDLLSLNAAIEASRAGSRGRTFSVIAGEVRRLASETQNATGAVTAIVNEVAKIGDHVAEATAITRERTDATSTGASGVHQAVEALQASFGSTMRHANDVAATAEKQAALLDGVLRQLRDGSDAAAKTTSDGADEGRMELLHLYSRAHRVAAQRSVARSVAELRGVTTRIANQFEALIDAAVTKGRIPRGAFDDFAYTEIVGPSIARLGRLFDVSRVPLSGFSPPKYVTAWDAAIDEALCDALEEAYTDTQSPKKIMIAVVDLNGFVIAHPRCKIHDWTGDPAVDFTGNRIKRFVEDDFSLSSIRFGLCDDIRGIPKRAGYQAFRNAGAVLEHPSGERPWKVVVSARDIGDVFSELLTAIYANGKRIGTIRMAYDPTLL